MYSYTYPITRYNELTTVVHRDTPLPDNEEEVMAFYDQYISSEDLDRIIDGYNSGEVSDTWDYIKDHIIDRDPSLEPCRYREIMGELKYYEGLSQTPDGSYKVDLGS